MDEVLTSPPKPLEPSLQPTDDMPDLLSDCQIMLRFALKEAIPVPDDLLHEIAQLDQTLVKLGLPTISAMPRKLFSSDQIPGPTDPAVMPNELLLKVHSALSLVVAPATALTLQISEPPPGKHRFLGGLPMLVKAASWTALACAFGFVFTSLPSAKTGLEKAATQAASATPTPTPSPTATPTPTVQPSSSS